MPGYKNQLRNLVQRKDLSGNGWKDDFVILGVESTKKLTSKEIIVDRMRSWSLNFEMNISLKRFTIDQRGEIKNIRHNY